jgi:hypothetical protein
LAAINGFDEWRLRGRHSMFPAGELMMTGVKVLGPRQGSWVHLPVPTLIMFRVPLL